MSVLRKKCKFGMALGQSIKDTVSGYIRNAQQLFPPDDSYFNILPSIEIMVLDYYWLKEYFTQIGHVDVRVNDERNTVSRSYPRSSSAENYCTVYGNVMVETNKDRIYEWRVKMGSGLHTHRNQFHGDLWQVGIGLCADNTLTNECFEDNAEKCGFCVWDVEKTGFRGGDTVKIIVDTQSQQCEVWINQHQKNDINAKMKWNQNYYFAVCFGKSTLNKHELSAHLIHFDCKELKSE